MSDLLNRAALLLEEADFFLVPVHELNNLLKYDEPGTIVSDGHLANILRGDERFRVFSSDIEMGKGHYSEESLSLLHEHGISVGPRVMLASRVPTKHEVLGFLLEKANQTFETLKQAWDIRPDDDELTEDKLLDALAKAQRLQRQLKGLVNDDLQQQEHEEDHLRKV